MPALIGAVGCSGWNLMGRFRLIVSLLREFWLFVREERIWWMVPILVVIAFLGVFTIFVQGSALAPFIYALF